MIFPWSLEKGDFRLKPEPSLENPYILLTKCMDFVIKKLPETSYAPLPSEKFGKRR